MSRVTGTANECTPPLALELVVYFSSRSGSWAMRFRLNTKLPEKAACMPAGICLGVSHRSPVYMAAHTHCRRCRGVMRVVVPSPRRVRGDTPCPVDRAVVFAAMSGGLRLGLGLVLGLELALSRMVGVGVGLGLTSTPAHKALIRL